MTPVEKKIWQIAAPIAKDQGVRLVRVRLGGGATPTLQLMLEPREASPENFLSVSVDQCEAFSRELSAVLDVEDPVPDAYRLEVSSTGLERPLVTLEDFTAYAPHRVKLKTTGPIAGQKRFTGVLEAVEGDVLHLRHEGAEQATEIPFAEVASARLAFTPAEEEALIKQIKTA
mgnify:CR=1 FL=1